MYSPNDLTNIRAELIYAADVMGLPIPDNIKASGMTPEQEAARFRISERDSLEEKHTPDIQKALEDMITAVISDGMTDNEIANAPNRLQENSTALEAALLAFYLAMSDVGIDAAQDDLIASGLAVDLSVVDVQAKEEARRLAAIALPQIIDTTQRAMGNAIPTWLQNAERSIADLLAELKPQYSTGRATNITRTGGTDVFSKGVEVVGRDVGVVELEAYTMRDEKVCPICRPMHGQRRNINGQYDSSLPAQGPPGWHNRCRCGELMVIRSIKT